MRIATKLGISATIAAVVAGALQFGLVYREVLDLQQERAIASQFVIAERLMHDIDHTMQLAGRDLRMIVEDEFLQDFMTLPETDRGDRYPLLKEELQERMELTGPWDSLMVLDRNGQHLISPGSRGGHGNIHDYPASREAFLQALQGRFYVSDLVHSDHLGEDSVIFAAPIHRVVERYPQEAGDEGGADEREKEGMVSGVVLAQFRWSVIKRIIGQLGTPTDVHLFNRYGRVIASSDAEGPGEDDKVRLPSTIQQNIAKSPNGYAVASSSHGRQDMFMVYVSEKRIGDYAGHGWGLLLEQPATLVFNPVQQVAERTAVLITIILLGLATVLVLLAHGWLRPLAALNRVADRVGQGMFDHKLPASRSDEVGELASTFNRMIDQLRDHTQALTTSKAEFQRLVDLVPDAVYTASAADFHTSYISPSVETMLGFPVDEWLGQPGFWVRTIHPEDRQGTLSQMAEALRKGQSYNVEYRMLHRDGETMRWFQDRGTWVRDGEGRIVTVQGLLTDITERRHALDALRDSERKFHTISNAAQDAIILTDEDNRVVYWNPAAERILGYGESEIIGHRLYDLLVPVEQIDHVRAGFQRFAASGEGPMVGKTLELEALHKHGYLLPVELSVSALRMDGRWHAVGILRDISARKREETRLERTTRALGALHASDRLLTRATNERQLLNGVCRSLVRQAGHDFVWLGLFDPKQPGTLQLAAMAVSRDAAAVPHSPPTACLHDAAEQACPAWRALHGRRAEIVTDIQAFTAAPQWRDAALADGWQSAMSLPLLDGDQALGVISIYGRQAGLFDEEEADLLHELADNLVYGMRALRTRDQHLQAQDRLVHQAFHDSLTGLPNRAMLLQALEEVIGRLTRVPGAAGILFIDLDDFKLVNDTLGHDAGDEVLRQVGGRLQGVLRGSDMVARQGGDEFIILMSWLCDGRDGMVTEERPSDCSQEAAVVAERVVDALKQPFLIQGQDTYLGASIGIALCPYDASDSQTLLRFADSAMYRAKEVGKGYYAFYSRELSERQHHRMSLANQLHKAIEQQEFVLHYQPIIDLQTGRLVGTEALIRWQHPDGRLVAPAEFLPVAEDMSLIIPIGEWVMGEACRQVRCWCDAGTPLYVAVNLSVRQLWHSDVVSMVMDNVSRNGIDRSLLELEVTESAMTVDPARMEDFLTQFDQHGIRISLDDFGTGYSSLNRLKHLPIHTLKIDQSFVDGVPGDADDVAIVSATILLARSLSLCSLAEGIETADQWQWLRAAGCGLGQGYYFSRPVPPDEIAALLAKGGQWPLSALPAEADES